MLMCIKEVEPLEDYELLLTFDTGEQKIYDVKPLLDRPIFSRLRNKGEFKKVYIDRIMDTVAWDENTDICPDSLYRDGVAWNPNYINQKLTVDNQPQL